MGDYRWKMRICSDQPCRSGMMVSLLSLTQFVSENLQLDQQMGEFPHLAANLPVKKLFDRSSPILV